MQRQQNLFIMGARLRHETDHAHDMAERRRITEAERKKVLERPDRVSDSGDYREHYDDSSRGGVSIVAIIAVGFGTAILTKSPIFGLGVGTFCTIVTWMLKRK